MILMAARNLLRNFRRSVVIMAAVIFAVALVTFARFLSYGSHEETVYQAVQLTSGYLQLVANGYIENPSLERAMDITPEILESLRVEGVTSIVKRVQGSGLASLDENAKFINIIGTQPEEEIKVTLIHKRMIRGNYLKTGIIEKDREGRIVYSCILGEKLAGNLNAKIGSTISLVTSQFDGAVGVILAKVSGIYKTDDNQLDYSTVYITLNAGHELFGTNTEKSGIQRLTSIVLGVKDLEMASKVYAKLRPKFPLPVLLDGEKRENSLSYSPVIYLWRDLLPGVIQLIDFDQVGTEFTIFFIVFIMAFGILNIVQMAIHERKREFAVLIALGTKPKRIFLTFLLEIFFLILPGLVLGCLIGMGVGYYFDINPIMVTGDLSEIFTSSAFAPILRSVVTFNELIIGMIWVLLPSALFSVFAARRILKIDPLKEIAGR